MGRYVSRQLASIIPTILLSIVINFLLLHAAPGDPARVMAGRDNPTEAQIAAIRADLGLDQPLPVQFWRYVQQLAQGNLGESIAFKQPVFSLIIVVVATLGSGIVYVMIVIGLTAWPTSARLMWAQALTLRDRTFIQALRALGESSPRILVRHIIPNGIQPLIANASLDIASATRTRRPGAG